MRLICPSCGAQYEVDDQLIPDDGRDVQCSNCGTAWFQRPPPLGSEFSDALGTNPELQTPAPDEDDGEGMLPPAGAPVPRGRAASRLDDEVRSILMEEAAREQRARRMPPQIETQAELGLDPRARPAPRPAPPRSDVNSALAAAPPQAFTGDPVKAAGDDQPAPVAKAPLSDRPAPPDAGKILAEATAASSAIRPAGAATPPTEVKPNGAAAKPAEPATAARQGDAGLEAQLDPVADEPALPAKPASFPAVPPAEVKPLAAAASGKPAESGSAASPLPKPSEAAAAAAIRSASATVAAPSRRDLLPDIEEINSSLRSAEEQAAEAEADDTRTRGGFGFGFMAVVCAALVAVLVYVFAAAIGQKIPALEPALSTYVTWVDAARIWLDARARAVVAALRG